MLLKQVRDRFVSPPALTAEPLCSTKKTARMKKITPVLVLLLVGIIAFGQKSDTLYNGSCGTIIKTDIDLKTTLQKIDLRQFTGKTVEEMLQNKTIKLYKEIGYFVNESTGEIESVSIIFAPGLQISIVSKPLKYTSNFIKTLSFDFEQFKKETITTLALDTTLFDELISDNTNKKTCAKTKK